MRRLPAFLIAIFFVFPVFLAALFTVSISTWVLDRGFYTNLVSDERLYEIPDSPAFTDWSYVHIPGIPAFNATLTPKEVREILTPSYLKSQAVSVVGQAFDIVQNRSVTDDIAVDLKPVKTALLSSAGHSELARSLPDTVRLSDVTDFRPLYYPWGMRPHVSAVGIMIAIDLFLLLIACGFWMAAGFAGGATLYGRLQWWGWTLLAPAFFVFVTGVITAICAGAGWIPWGIRSAHLETEGFSASFVSAVIETVRHVLTRVGIGFIATGAIPGGVSMGLLGWSWSIPNDERAVVPANHA